MEDIVEDIELQLACLLWRKQRNERAIREIVTAKLSKQKCNSKVVGAVATKKILE
jgi:hypothetical protein